MLKPEIWYALSATREGLYDCVKSLEKKVEELDPIATMFVKADLGKLWGLLDFMDKELEKWETEQ